MKIAFLGAGATGSVFASYLKLGGADDIWLIDLYKAHMDAVRDNGLVMKDHNGEHHLTGFHTAYSAEEVGPVDVLVVLTKSTHTISALEGAGCCITEKTAVVSLQNGLGNDLDLEQFVDKKQVCCGCGRIGTVLEAPGVCVSKPAQGIVNMYACIAHPVVEDEYLTRDSENFHRQLGFSTVGEFHQCACKFGRWYNMIWMEKFIGEHA